MEYNERINIENYSHFERRTPTSFGNIIRTTAVGLSVLVVLFFILNSSQKYVKNYQNEILNQQMRNFENIEKHRHREFLLRNLLEIKNKNSEFKSCILDDNNSNKKYFTKKNIKKLNKKYNEKDFNKFSDIENKNISNYYFDYINKFRKLQNSNSYKNISLKVLYNKYLFNNSSKIKRNKNPNDPFQDFLDENVTIFLDENIQNHNFNLLKDLELEKKTYIYEEIVENTELNNKIFKFNSTSKLNSYNLNKIPLNSSSISSNKNSTSPKNNLIPILYLGNTTNHDNLTSIALQNQTLEDLKYKELLEKYLKDRDPVELLQIQTYFNRIDSISYIGKWYHISGDSIFGNYSEGEIILKFEKFSGLDGFNSVTSNSYNFRITQGKFIDNWIIFKGISFNFVDVTYSNNTVTASFSSLFENGQLFEKKSEQQKCSGVFKLIIDPEDKINPKTENFNLHENPIKKIKGTFESDCKLNIKFELGIFDHKPIYKKITIYSVIITVFAILQMMNTLFLIKKIQNSVTYSNAISLLTVGQNIIWDSYACLCHFFLTINYDKYIYQFGIPSFFFFVNFSIFELKLLYLIWKNQNVRDFYDSSLIRKKLMKFYSIFYVFMFLSLFFVMKFLFEKNYIFLAVLVTWVPQIVYNVVEKNRLSMPFISVLVYSLNKIFLPVKFFLNVQAYFRGCPVNFFKVSNDSVFIMTIFVILVIMILILYTQNLFGPRWFLPERFKLSEKNFYKTKSEILLDKSDAENVKYLILINLSLNV